MSPRQFIWLGLFLAVLAPLSIIAGVGQKGTQYALLVAISKYAKTDQWRPLPYTHAEMREFREALLETGFRKENIEFLHDGQTDEKLRPTGANLLRKIKLMLDEIGPGDTFLIALNGHGVQYKSDATGYFCPVNADLADKRTLVAMDGGDGIYKLLETCKARRKLLIVNACRNDPTRDVSFAAEKFQLVDKDESEVPNGIAALFSCKPGQKSYYYPEEEKIERSMFYNHLIQAWRGQYAEGEKVTLDHVFDVVTRKTAADARRLFSESQTPWPRRLYEGEWLVAKVATDLPKVPAKPKIVPGSKLFTNSVGMKMALIPAGKFLMGSPASENDGRKSELQHQVEISKPFNMGVHEVTIGQFRRFVKDQGYRTEAEKDGEGGWGYNETQNRMESYKPQYTWQKAGWTQSDDHPVVNVTWNDAKAFCAWLSKRENKSYGLPSEVQWEYACRAGTKTAYSNGNDMENLTQVGNVADASLRARISDYAWTLKGQDGYVFTAPVGQFRKNDFGLFDMHGNVWEWCEDWYDAKYYENSPPVDPLNTVEGKYRVLRGGAWNCDPRLCRSALRGQGRPVYRDFCTGFRVVSSP